jgi:hypothetical protein
MLGCTTKYQVTFSVWHMTAFNSAPLAAARRPLPPAPLKSTLPLTSAAIAAGPPMTMVSFSKPWSLKKPLASAI